MQVQVAVLLYSTNCYFDLLVAVMLLDPKSF